MAPTTRQAMARAATERFRAPRQLRLSGWHGLGLPATSNVPDRSQCDPWHMALRCLIVDDNLEYGVAARVLLEGDGVVVVGIATSSDGAVRQVEDLQPDVALLDINLGEESGFDLARRLADLEHLARPPSLIFISTVDGDQFAELIDASPALGFIPKARLSADAIHAMLADDGVSTGSG